jgi:hypothetical protein
VTYDPRLYNRSYVTTTSDSALTAERVITAADASIVITDTGSQLLVGNTASGTNAPTDAQYLTLALNSSLSAERTFTVGNNAFATDGGANGAYTVQVSKLSSNSGTTVNLSSTSNTIQLCDATSGNVTVNLPAASGASEKVFTVKKTDSSSNTVTLDGNASETIDGATTFVLSAQYQSITVACDGSNWFIL